MLKIQNENTEGEEFSLHKFPDGNFARARPRGFCLSCFADAGLHSNKNIAADFESLRNAKQFALLHRDI